jgi:hypothetical protein
MSAPMTHTAPSRPVASSFGTTNNGKVFAATANAYHNAMAREGGLPARSYQSAVSSSAHPRLSNRP